MPFLQHTISVPELLRLLSSANTKIVSEKKTLNSFWWSNLYGLPKGQKIESKSKLISEFDALSIIQSVVEILTPKPLRLDLILGTFSTFRINIYSAKQLKLIFIVFFALQMVFNWISHQKFDLWNAMSGVLLFISYSYVTPNQNWSVDRKWSQRKIKWKIQIYVADSNANKYTGQINIDRFKWMKLI